MTQVKFVQEIPIINGTYKKDTPNGEIGYQKWEVEVPYEVVYRYTITAKTKSEWNTVANYWQEAVDLMKEVPESHPEYKTAQTKIQNNVY